METLLKKFLYTGVGLAAMATEKVQKTVEKLIHDDKLSMEEGKKIIDDFVKNTKTKRKEFESQLKSITERIVNSFNFATENEFAELRKRVENLEVKLNNGSKPVPPKPKGDKKVEKAKA